MNNSQFWKSREWIVPPGLVDPLYRFDALCEFMIDTKQSKKSKPLLIHGNTGVGKSMFTDYFLHKYTKAKQDSTIKFTNCAALPSELLESELFGHIKGSFTGASKDKKGVFEYVNNGVLVLEEIGEMPKELQAKLLTAIETKTFSKVGCAVDIQLTAQIVATTNVDQSKFRPDFWYRFNVFSIPPINERRGDIIYYMYNFYPEIIELLSCGAVLSALCYNWPGNVREIERVCDSIRMNVNYAKSKGFLNKRNFNFTISEYPKEQYAAIMKIGSGVSNFEFNKASILLNKLIKNGIDTESIEEKLNTFSLSLDCFGRKFKQEKYSKFYLGENIKFNSEIDNIIRTVNIQFGMTTGGFCIFCALFFQDIASDKDILDLTSIVKDTGVKNDIVSKDTFHKNSSDRLIKNLAEKNMLADFFTFCDIKTKSMIDHFSEYDNKTQLAIIECLKFMTGITDLSCDDATNLRNLYTRNQNNKFLAEYFGEIPQKNADEISITEISLDELRILYYETICNTIGTRHGFQKELAKIAKRTPGRITQELEKFGLKEKFSKINFYPKKRLVILKG